MLKAAISSEAPPSNGIFAGIGGAATEYLELAL
jgi:hypothetical protein